MPDTFHEINGVAHTSRQFEAYARRQQIPFLSIHCGPRTRVASRGAVEVSELKRGFARVSLDANLDYDLLLMRYAGRVLRQVRDFGAELIHVTGPGDVGMLGCYVAWRLKLPVVMSWHTSLHEYAGRRLRRVLQFLGAAPSEKIGAFVEKISFDILAWFYRRARVVLAPNVDLVETMRGITRRPVYLMPRGVETELFTPAKRTRIGGRFRLGYVGRLTAEKNVRFLADLGGALLRSGCKDFEFVIVGQGGEEAWLRENVPNALFTGVLIGEQLAAEFANMDLFVFPSLTDTYGNVVLEALASGVPAVVTTGGGPKFLVKAGVTGYAAGSDLEFVSRVELLMRDSELHASMRVAAREYASGLSWDRVFEGVFQAYEHCWEDRLGAAVNPSSSGILTMHERGGA